MVVLPRIAKPALTGTFSRAASENSLERAFCIDRYVCAEGNLGRHDAVEYEATRVLRIAPQVVLGDARPVGHPVEVDLLVAERLPYAIEIFDGHTRGVQRYVRPGIQRLQTPACFVQQCAPIVVQLGLIASRAVEGVRFSGTPLIDEHDVTITMDSGEHRRGHGIERGRRHSWTAKEQKQRIRPLASADGGNSDEGHAYLPAAVSSRVLRREQLAAIRSHGGQALRMLQLAR